MNKYVYVLMWKNSYIILSIYKETNIRRQSYIHIYSCFRFHALYDGVDWL